MPKYNLDPVLLFKAEDKGVYYRPQYGVIMDGIVSNGSLRTVAKHIHRQHIEKYEPGQVDPGSMSEEDILNEVTRFILEGEEEDGEEEEEEEEEE